MSKEQAIVDHLTSTYDPVAIVLYGSRGSDGAREHSDWDLLVVVHHVPKNGSGGMFEGEYLDVEFLPLLPLSEEVVLHEYRLENTIGSLGAPGGARVLFEMDGTGTELISVARAIFDKGRNLSPLARQDRIDFITQRLSKLEDDIDDEGVFFYHLGVFYEKAIQYWFELKHNRWSCSPRIALGTIRNEDAEFAEHLGVLVGCEKSQQKYVAAAQLLTCIV